jgi:hypothetical protein
MGAGAEAVNEHTERERAFKADFAALCKKHGVTEDEGSDLLHYDWPFTLEREEPVCDVCGHPGASETPAGPRCAEHL